MSAQLRFTVQDCYAWSPGSASLAERASSTMPSRESSGERGAEIVLPAMLRRRLTPTGQLLIKAALTCAGNRHDVRYILATRDGELTRTLNILAAVAQDELPSPADFSVSVHHALLGLLSIHTKNKLGHTAVSAGADSFAYGLLEAAGCVSGEDAQPVLLLYCDEPLPGPYVSFEEDGAPRQPLVLALLLSKPDTTNVYGLQFSARQADAMRVTCLAHDFLDFMLSDRKRQTAVGSDMTWEWSRAA